MRYDPTSLMTREGLLWLKSLLDETLALVADVDDGLPVHACTRLARLACLHFGLTSVVMPARVTVWNAAATRWVSDRGHYPEWPGEVHDYIRSGGVEVNDGYHVDPENPNAVRLILEVAERYVLDFNLGGLAVPGLAHSLTPLAAAVDGATCPEDRFRVCYLPGDVTLVYERSPEQHSWSDGDVWSDEDEDDYFLSVLIQNMECYGDVPHSLKGVYPEGGVNVLYG